MEKTIESFNQKMFTDRFPAHVDRLCSLLSASIGLLSEYRRFVGGVWCMAKKLLRNRRALINNYNADNYSDSSDHYVIRSVRKGIMRD